MEGLAGRGSMVTAEPAFHTFLKTLTLGDMVKKKTRPLISINKGSSVQEALDLMSKEKVLSLPVEDEKGDILGVVNMTDLATAIAFQPCFEKFKQGPERLSGIRKAEFEGSIRTRLFETEIENMLGVTTEGKSLWAYPAAESLERVLELFSKGVHRVLVTMPDGTRRNLSQSDVLMYLKENLRSLGDIVDQEIKDMGLVRKGELATVSMYDSALCAFQAMYAHGKEYGGVPIVDKTGDIVATISNSDMRGLNKDSLGLLLLPVLDYLRIATGGARPVVQASPSSTLKEVMYKAVYARVHRVWVVEQKDSKTKVTGVVTLSDILTKFSPYDFLA